MVTVWTFGTKRSTDRFTSRIDSMIGFAMSCGSCRVELYHADDRFADLKSVASKIDQAVTVTTRRS
jgi:hypothetical protein